MRILALDLGSKTGYASSTGSTVSGIEDFTPKPRESKGMRFLRFESWLREAVGLVKPDLIIYEQPHHRGGAATAVLAGMVAILQKLCVLCDIEYTSIHSATLKKYATGSGRASKREMIDKAHRKFNKTNLDDNEADALWILDWGVNKFGK